MGASDASHGGAAARDLRQALAASPTSAASPSLAWSPTAMNPDAPGPCCERASDASSTDQGASFSTTCANIVTATLGAGILSLPWSAAGVSSVMSIVIVGAILGLNLWVSFLIVEAAERFQVFDIGALLRVAANGRRGAEASCNLCCWACEFCCLVAYLIIVADAAGQVLYPDQPDLLRTDRSQRALVLGLASLAFLPVCFLPPSALGATSILAILVNLYLFGIVFYEATIPFATAGLCIVGAGPGMVTLATTLGTAVVIQMCLLPMYEGMEGRSVPRFKQAMKVSFAVVFVLLALFTVLCNAAFVTVQQNVLENLDEGPFATAARVGMVAVMLGCYPLNLMPMVAPLKTLSLPRRQKHLAVTSATVAIVIAAYVVSVLIADLGAVNLYIGSLSVLSFGSLIPAFIGTRCLDTSMYATVPLAIFGVGCAGLGVAYTTNFEDNLSCWFHI